MPCHGSHGNDDQGQSITLAKEISDQRDRNNAFNNIQTPQPKPAPSRAENLSAMTTMAQGLTNKPVTEAQLKGIAQQVSKDPEAQSALRSIDTALTPEHTVKYCPENGERFSADMTYCPDGKVKLEWVD